MSAKSKREVADGFGSIWQKCSVGRCGLEIVRPGKVQCWCDGLDMPASEVETLARHIGVPEMETAWIVLMTERRCRENRDTAAMPGPCERDSTPAFPSQGGHEPT